MISNLISYLVVILIPFGFFLSLEKIMGIKKLKIDGKKAQMDLEVLEEPGFWILGGGAAIATILGYILSKRMDLIPLPWWQLIIIIVGEFIVAAYFVSRG